MSMLTDIIDTYVYNRYATPNKFAHVLGDSLQD